MWVAGTAFNTFSLVGGSGRFLALICGRVDSTVEGSAGSGGTSGAVTSCGEAFDAGGFVSWFVAGNVFSLSLDEELNVGGAARYRVTRTVATRTTTSKAIVNPLQMDLSRALATGCGGTVGIGGRKFVNLRSVPSQSQRSCSSS